MKNRKHHIIKTQGEQRVLFVEQVCEEQAGEVIGNKVLYNWLYQQEEKDYYSNAEVPDSLPDFSLQEALFVEY